MNDRHLFNRDCGILLHPSSLPSDYGVGDFGPASMRWIETLAAAQQSLWQILPLNPAGYGDSPYQGLSAFAANPIFISPEELRQREFLSDDELQILNCRNGSLDYEGLCNKNNDLVGGQISFKATAIPLIKATMPVFLRTPPPGCPTTHSFMPSRNNTAASPGPNGRQNCETATQRPSNATPRICRTKSNASILNNSSSLNSGPPSAALPVKKKFASLETCPFLSRTTVSMSGAGRNCSSSCPMVAVVAGVPPDYFSATGQLWGNPIYEWEAHQNENFQWWRKRVQQTLNWVDIIRIDHFRGFDACWEVPAEASTAAEGKWVPSCGAAILEALATTLGNPLPFIAEDLGVTTTPWSPS